MPVTEKSNSASSAIEVSTLEEFAILDPLPF